MATTVTDFPGLSAAIRPRADVLGIGVDAINLETAVARLCEAAERKQKGYVCVTPVHGIVEAQTDTELRESYRRAFMVTPDGMPTVWVGKLQGHKQMGRVYGPDLLLAVCQVSAERGYTHFFYGGAEGVAPQLALNLAERFPGLQVAGTYTPPFRPLNESEQSELESLVAAARPDFFWVGIGAPKQEKFMLANYQKLDAGMMLGVGAAFDFHTGRVREAPAWMKRSGLQWLHRLCQEPRRLAKRYFTTNSQFLYQISRQFLGLRRAAQQ